MLSARCFGADAEGGLLRGARRGPGGACPLRHGVPAAGGAAGAVGAGRTSSDLRFWIQRQSMVTTEQRAFPFLS